MNKWYMHNPEPVLEDEMHKLPWNLEIQMDHCKMIRPCKKKKTKKKKNRTCQIVDFTVPADQRVKLKESEKKD